jgi:hypothetical protein
MGWLYRKLHNEKNRARRRDWGIQAWVGANGGGKTAGMVWDALPDLLAGRPVLSTVRISDFESPRECDDPECEENPDRLGHYKRVPTSAGRLVDIANQKRLFLEGQDARQDHVETEVVGVHQAAHPLWIPWSRWDQLLKFNFGRVLADEMTGVASSLEQMSLPSEVINQLQQLRRSEIPFSYTAPDWSAAAKKLREPTQAVTVCTGYMATEAPRLGELERVWRARRLFKWQTYEARNLDQLTEGRRTEQGPETVDWHWGPSSPAFEAYDTFAPVLQVGTTSIYGRCFRCGGKRPDTKCQCADADVDVDELLQVQPRPPGRRRNDDTPAKLPGLEPAR